MRPNYPLSSLEILNISQILFHLPAGGLEFENIVSEKKSLALFWNKDSEKVLIRRLLIVLCSPDCVIIGLEQLGCHFILSSAFRRESPGICSYVEDWEEKEGGLSKSLVLWQRD